MDVSTIAPTVATMVGLGVGIDYALLLVTRHVEGLRPGATCARPPRARRHRRPLGRLRRRTVLVSLLGLGLAGLPTYDAFGYRHGHRRGRGRPPRSPWCPPLCGLAGRRLLPRHGAPARAPATATAARSTARWAAPGRPPAARRGRWSPLVAAARRWPRRPSACAPGRRTPAAQPAELDHPPGLRPGRRRVRPGRQRPAPVRRRPRAVADAGDLGTARRAGAPRRRRRASRQPVASPTAPPRVLVAEPTTGPPDERDHRRWSTTCAPTSCPTASQVTGATPVFADIADLLDERLWLVIAFVVGVSVLLLTLVFRSPVVAAQGRGDEPAVASAPPTA